jgi:ATP-dependent RNA helicase DDX18/HAS1
VEKNYYLNKSAADGYRSYLQAYASHSLKKVFDVNALDLQKVGRAFGFTVPPRVNLLIGASGKTDRAQRRGSGNAGYQNKKKDDKDYYDKQRTSVAGASGRKSTDGRQWTR